MQKNICVALGDDLMTALRENKLLRNMNRSALVRDAVSEYIDRYLVLQGRAVRENNKKEKNKE